MFYEKHDLCYSCVTTLMEQHNQNGNGR